MSPANGSQASTLPQKDGSELSENREPTSCREGPWQAGSTHRVLEEAPGGKEVTRPHPAGRMCLRSPEPRGMMALLPAPHSPAVDLCTCAQLRKPLRPASLSRVSQLSPGPCPLPHTWVSTAAPAGLVCRLCFWRIVQWLLFAYVMLHGQSCKALGRHADIRTWTQRGLEMPPSSLLRAGPGASPLPWKQRVGLLSWAEACPSRGSVTLGQCPCQPQASPTILLVIKGRC